MALVMLSRYIFGFLEFSSTLLVHFRLQMYRCCHHYQIHRAVLHSTGVLTPWNLFREAAIAEHTITSTPVGVHLHPMSPPTHSTPLSNPRYQLMILRIRRLLI